MLTYKIYSNNLKTNLVYNIYNKIYIIIMESEDHGLLLKKQWDKLYQSEIVKLILKGRVDKIFYKKTGAIFTAINESYKNKRQSTMKKS